MNTQHSTNDIIGASALELAKLMHLGTSSFTAGRHEHARRVFQLIIKLEPALYMPHHFLGILEEKANRLEEAAHAYAQAGSLLDAMPARSKEQDAFLQEIAFSLGVVLLRLGRSQEGCEYLFELYAARSSLEPDL